MLGRNNYYHKEGQTMLKKTKMDLGSNNSDLFDKLVKYCMASGAINLDLYAEYDVKRGLRDSNGKGVLTGLTEISDVLSYKLVDGRKIPCDGELYYQGYNIEDLVKGFFLNIAAIFTAIS